MNKLPYNINPNNIWEDPPENVGCPLHENPVYSDLFEHRKKRQQIIDQFIEEVKAKYLSDISDGDK